MSYLGDIQKCIHKSAEITGISRNYLEEKLTNTKVKINTDGKYLLYDFEKVKPRLFPFFENSGVPVLNKIADKVLFVEGQKDLLWVFVIELKQNKGEPYKQIKATKQFVEFLLNSINHACKTKYTPQLRGIAHSKMHRPTTKIKNPYDKNYNAHISGDNIIISNFFY